MNSLNGSYVIIVTMIVSQGRVTVAGRRPGPSMLVILKLKWASASGLVKTQMAGPQPGADSAGLGWALRMCISNMLGAMLILWIEGPHFENH